MQSALGFIQAHPIWSALIAIVVVPPLVQCFFWIWRLFFRRSYYRWLLRRGWLVRLIGSSDIVALWITFGDPESAVKYLGKRYAEENEELLIKSTRSKNPAVSREACRILAEMGSARAIPDLIQVLREHRRSTESHASNALARLAQTHPEVLRLLAAAMDGSSQDRGIVSLLGELGGQDEIQAALSRLTDIEALQHAAKALGKSKNAGVSAALMAIDARSDENLMIAIVQGLGQVGSPESVDYLAAALRAASPHVRCAAAVALGAPSSPTAVAPLLEGLSDSQATVRAAAAAALGRHRDRSVVAPLIRALVFDHHNTVAYADALAEIGDRRAIAPLSGMLLFRQSVAQELIAAIVRIGGSEAAEALLATLQPGPGHDELTKKITLALAEMTGTPAPDQLGILEPILAGGLSYQYEPLGPEDLDAVARWVRGGSLLEIEVTPPTCHEEECGGPYGESWDTVTVVDRKGRIRLTEKPRDG